MTNRLNSVLVQGKVSSLNEQGFTVATERKYTCNGEISTEVSYFDVDVHNIKAEVKVGDKVDVVGQLKQKVWTKDGKKRARVYILAEDLEVKE